MKKYRVEVREVSSRAVSVDAVDANEAIDTVKQQYNNEVIVLDAADFQGVNFEVIDD